MIPVSASTLRNQITTLQSLHYVYVLYRPDRTPFYVGKGQQYRVFAHEAEARNLQTRTHKLNVIRSIWKTDSEVMYSIESSFDLECDALHYEKALIHKIGRHDLDLGPLTNQTDGGEGASNPSEASRARHRATLGGEADDPERRAINIFFHSLGDLQDSVPIKPLNSAPKLQRLTPHPQPRNPSPRMVRALAASAVANRVLLENGCKIPRTFRYQDVNYVVENGVGRDILKAKLASLNSSKAEPIDEVFVLSATGFEYLLANVNGDRLIDAGIMEPN